MTINLKEAMERFDNDEEIYIDLVDAFLDVGATDIAELKAAFGARDMKQVLYLAHKLKGAALTIGAEELSRDAASVEQALRENISADVSAPISHLIPLYGETAEELSRIQARLRKQP